MSVVPPLPPINKNKRSRARFSAKFPASHYRVVASAVASLPMSEEERKKVSDHFVKIFNERSNVFNAVDFRRIAEAKRSG